LDALRDRQAPAPTAQGSFSEFDKKAEAAAPAAKLGTGHGRIEDSVATRVRFERASSSPNETVVVRYDRRENLVAMGVLPTQWPRYAERSPNPFPANRGFVPDPR
jgi:hypothetical protein